MMYGEVLPVLDKAALKDATEAQIMAALEQVLITSLICTGVYHTRQTPGAGYAEMP